MMMNVTNNSKVMMNVTNNMYSYERVQLMQVGNCTIFLCYMDVECAVCTVCYDDMTIDLK